MRTLIIVVFMLFCGARGQNIDDPEVAKYRLAMTSVGSINILAIRYNGSSDKYLSSAFLISEDGLAITTSHSMPLESNYKSISRSISFYIDSEVVGVFPFKIVGRIEEYDITIIKIDSKNKFVPLDIGISEYMKPGQQISIFGFPLGADIRMTFGRIASHKTDSAGRWEADINTTYGNSGGPVINNLGRVIGICTGGIPKVQAPDGSWVDLDGFSIILPIDKIYPYLQSRYNINRGTESVLSKSLSLPLPQYINIAKSFNIPKGSKIEEIVGALPGYQITDYESRSADKELRASRGSNSVRAGRDLDTSTPNSTGSSEERSPKDFFNDESGFLDPIIAKDKIIILTRQKLK